MTRSSGVSTWPPRWTKSHGDGNSKLSGEIGTLTKVLINPALDNTIFLWMENEGAEYVTALVFDDRSWCLQLHNLLKSKIGVSLRAIGDIDLANTL